MQLSKHFTLSEMIKSQTALRKGIDNTPSEQVINNLKQLCINVLEKVREHFDKPILINSGYRSVKLNTAIGGSKTSQHVTGEAADIEIPGISNLELAIWIKDNLKFDQLILEFHNKNIPDSGWVHVSWNSNLAKNRNQVLTIDKNGTKPGLPISSTTMNTKKVIKTSLAGLSLIKQFEGFEPKPYPDPGTGNLPITIGYGSTFYEDGTKVKLSDPAISEERATNLLKNVLKSFEQHVDSLVRDDVTQNQFDALICFAYNVGIGALKSSTLLKLVNKNPRDPLIKNEFLKWNKSGGKVLKGLTRRREAEANLYFS